MSDLSDRMRGQARSIEGTVPVLDGAEVQRIGKVARRRRHTRTGLLATGASAGVLALGGGIALMFLGGDDSTADPAGPTPSSSASDSPEPTPSISASAAPEGEGDVIPGFAPISQRPADQIPWDAVGPGWFAVDYHSADPVLPEADFEQTDLPQLTGGVSLVSPDGAWYAARSLESLGSGIPLAWDGENIWMGNSVATNAETLFYDVDILDLANGQKIGAIEGHAAENDVAFQPAKVLTYSYAGDGLSNNVEGLGVEGMGACSEAGSGFWGWEADDMSFTYSPAHGGQLVCFGPNEAGDRTEVTLVNVANVAESRKINELDLDAYGYAFVGWIDEDSFLFARENADGVGAASMFRYDLRDDSIVEQDASLYADVDNYQVRGYFDRVSQRHVITRNGTGGWSVGLYELDGTEVADVAGVCDVRTENQLSAKVHVSGGRLMVTCDEPGRVWMYDMSTGAEIGTWDVGQGAAVSAFDHPDN